MWLSHCLDFSVQDWLCWSLVLLSNTVKTWYFVGHVFRAWLVTASGLSFGKLCSNCSSFWALLSFWRKQHLIRTDHKVSATQPTLDATTQYGKFVLAVIQLFAAYNCRKGYTMIT